MRVSARPAQGVRLRLAAPFRDGLGKLANSTVNQSQAAICPVKDASPSCAMRSRTKNSVTRTETTSRHEETGILRQRARIELVHRSDRRRADDLAVEQPLGLCLFRHGPVLPSEGLAAERQEMLDHRPKGQGGEVLQEIENDDHADEQPDEQRAVGGNVPAEAGTFFFAASDPASASTGTT